VLPEKEEWLSGDAEWKIQRIGGDRAKFADLLYVRAGRTFGTGRFEFCQRFLFAGGYELDVSIRPVPYPPSKPEISSCLHNVPAKPNALHTSPNLEMYALHGASSDEFPTAPPTWPRLSTGPLSLQDR
jgi:hypothetical protein